MSDYFTSLVTRSFSPVAAVQPLGAAYAPVAAEEFPDPFTEADRFDDADAGAEENSPSSPSRGAVSWLETPIKEFRARTDQERPTVPPIVPSANSLSEATTQLGPEFPGPVSAHLRSRSNPIISEESHARETVPPPASLEPPITITSSTLSKEPALRRASGNRTLLGDRGISFQRERLAELPAAAAPLDESMHDKPSNRLARVAERANAAGSLTPDELLNIGPSAWPLIKKILKARPLSLPTSAARLTGLIAGTTDKLQTPAAAGRVDEPTTATRKSRQETRPSLTALIPQVSAQPLLPIKIKAPANPGFRQAPEETPARPFLSETIVNVAIGRIDVRAAAFENSKRERHRKGPKVMNLDDYAQQRSRGNP